MLFRVVSDIHLEHHASGTYNASIVAAHMNKAVPPISTDSESTLLLCGDISQYWPQRRDMLYAVASRFKKVVYVAGNHEHWGSNLLNWNAEAQSLEKLFKNVYVGRTNDACRTFSEEDGDLDIIYATMWSPYGRGNPVYEAALTGNADCKYIKTGYTDRQCLPLDFQQMYVAELVGIKVNLIESHKHGKQVAVVTHHVPSLKLRLPGLNPDPFDDMFMSSDAEAYMHEAWAPKFWFFGHTHKAWDIQIGKTRCVSNPYGYPGESYQGWVSAKVV